MKTQVVLIGVSEYEQGRDESDHLGNRPFVLAGCTMVEDTLRNLLPEKHGHRHLYLSNPRSKDELLTALEQLDLKGIDCLVCYYIGHGERPHSDNLLRLTTTNCTPLTVSRRGIQLTEILAALPRQPECRILLLDCCFSGKVDKLLLSRERQLTIVSSALSDQRARKGREGPVFTELLVEQLTGLSKHAKAFSLEEAFRGVPETCWTDGVSQQKWTHLDKEGAWSQKIFDPSELDKSITDYEQLGGLPADGAQLLHEIDATTSVVTITTDDTPGSTEYSFQVGQQLMSYDLFRRYCETSTISLPIQSRPTAEKFALVAGVSFYDALNFCNWLSHLAGFEPIYEFAEEGVRYYRNQPGYRLLDAREYTKLQLEPSPEATTAPPARRFRRSPGRETLPPQERNRLSLLTTPRKMGEWIWSPRVLDPERAGWNLSAEHSLGATHGHLGGEGHASGSMQWDALTVRKPIYGFRIVRAAKNSIE